MDLEKHLGYKVPGIWVIGLAILSTVIILMLEDVFLQAVVFLGTLWAIGWRQSLPRYTMTDQGIVHRIEPR